MLPQLLREMLLDQAISDLSCTSSETASAWQQFYQRCNLTEKIQQQVWLEHYGMGHEDLEVLTTGRLRIEKFFST